LSWRLATAADEEEVVGLAEALGGGAGLLHQVEPGLGFGEGEVVEGRLPGGREGIDADEGEGAEVGPEKAAEGGDGGEVGVADGGRVGGVEVAVAEILCVEGASSGGALGVVLEDVAAEEVAEVGEAVDASGEEEAVRPEDAGGLADGAGTLVGRDEVVEGAEEEDDVDGRGGEGVEAGGGGVVDAEDSGGEAGVGEAAGGGFEEAPGDVDEVEAAAASGEEAGILAAADADFGDGGAFGDPALEVAGGDGELDRAGLLEAGRLVGEDGLVVVAGDALFVRGEPAQDGAPRDRLRGRL
jgi:hypothetical protein